jgi:hypothetical protein
MREEKELGVENRDRIGCGLSTLVREGGFSPRTWGGSLELALVGLGWEVQDKHIGREGKRNGRRTGGPTLGLPPVPTEVVDAFIAAVYRGFDSITRQEGPS